ncbi:hypothetical protein [Streptosporangium sp. NPDC049376]|uniref:hypothetical protein n=1 Tax=Streptosporangium sp. NPDC049376 TaxID=3366192 RepID=UPI00378D02F2
MAAVKVLLGAGTVIVFAGGAAVPADVRVTPSTVTPGQSVAIAAGGCVAPATAYSAAFASTSARLRGRAETMRGTARINPHAAPGTYAVTVRCVRGGPYDGTFVVDEPRPVLAPDTGGGGLAMHAPGGATRTAWLFGALAMVVTVLGSALALTRGHRGQGGH